MTETIRKSESINELATALAKFQAEKMVIEKEQENYFYSTPMRKAMYASLGNIIETTRPLLAKHGLSLSQLPVTEERYAGVISILMHSSGQYIESKIMLRAETEDKHGNIKFNAQTQGAAITYARRYAWQSIVGVEGETDNDGNELVEEPAKAQVKMTKEKPKTDEVKPSAPVATGSDIDKLEQFLINNEIPTSWLLDRLTAKGSIPDSVFNLRDIPPETLSLVYKARENLKTIFNEEKNKKQYTDR